MTNELQFADIDNIEIKDIENFSPIYASEYYAIYEGVYNGKFVTTKLIITQDQTDIKEAIKEINLLRRFINTPNILRLLGYIYDNSLRNALYGIVVENNCLTLREYLDNNKCLSYDERACIMFDAVKGLEALHNKYETPILHKNLTSEYFYMTKNNVLKIGIGTKYRLLNKVNFMAYFDYNILIDIFSEYTIQSEIYSLGIILWEILTGKIPFKNMDYKAIYNMLINDNISEPLPLDAPLELQSIITACRAKDTNVRPTTTDINKFLDQYIN
ncbi:hypothetical protein [Fowlpox virus]|nr:hypothetical protein [Fowlpox virus]